MIVLYNHHHFEGKILDDNDLNIQIQKDIRIKGCMKAVLRGNGVTNKISDFGYAICFFPFLRKTQKYNPYIRERKLPQKGEVLLEEHQTQPSTKVASVLRFIQPQIASAYSNMFKKLIRQCFLHLTTKIDRRARLYRKKD